MFLQIKCLFLRKFKFNELQFHLNLKTLARFRFKNCVCSPRLNTIGINDITLDTKKKKKRPREQRQMLMEQIIDRSVLVFNENVCT